jgi:hypothetical protein
LGAVTKQCPDMSAGPPALPISCEQLPRTKTLVGLAPAVRVEASSVPTNWAQLRARHRTLSKPPPMPQEGIKRDRQQSRGISIGLARCLTVKPCNLTGPTPKFDGLVCHSRKDERLRREIVSFLEAVDANHPAVFAITGIDSVGRHQASPVLGRRWLRRIGSLTCQES